jgi:hypothetical protein
VVDRVLPLPRAREFDLVLVAMRTTVPATSVAARLARPSASIRIGWRR